jgi:anti-sigma regulatory factor (Ser/Thr protein kinase)
MSNTITITIQNDLGEIAMVHRTVQSFGSRFGVPEDSIFAINLALDEVLANVIHYAYPDSEVHEIHISLRYRSTELDITIVDNGNEFNPLKAPEPDLSLKLEDRPVGGLGVHLVKNVMSSMKYTRRESSNVLELTRTL